MTIQQCITIVDGYEPNAYTSEQKARWVQECEGRVFTQVFLQQPVNMTIPADPRISGQVVTGTAAILAQELALIAPYDRIYPEYLHAMIHYANGEYDRYSSSMQMFNNAWAELNRWFGRDFDVADRNRNRRVTVPLSPGVELQQQTLITVPPRCAFVGGRIVIRKEFAHITSSGGAFSVVPSFGTVLLYGGGAPMKTVGAWVMMGGRSISLPMVIGDVGGTEIRIQISDTDDIESDAYFTGVLCLPEEEFLYGKV